MNAAYDVRTMAPAEVETAIDWARAEGWNPGLNDATCFLTVDPDGFLGGYLDGELVATISVVNYDDAFAFVGFYIVSEPHRGQGYGYALWRAALPHAGSRVIGLDGVPAQIANYERSGFALAYRNIRYGGPIDGRPTREAGAGRIVGIGEVPFAALVAYDRTCFPAARQAFLSAWTTTPGHRALACMAGDALVGYGVLRPCHTGYKLGPQFANDAGVAHELIMALVAGAGPGPFFLDVPEIGHAAVALAGNLGLKPVFETARMYAGPAPNVAVTRIFGVSTFELG